MRVLIAEDDPISLRLLEERLGDWGYDVMAVGDGRAALAALSTDTSPGIAILDWMMPGLDGPAVCRAVRSANPALGPYLVLLTTRSSRDDLLAGFQAGADDYITKPFDVAELEARIRVAARVVHADRALASRVRELEAALATVRELRGLLPICAYCKRIRDDHEYWHEVESYMQAHAEVRFSHGICPECYTRVLGPEEGPPSGSGPPAGA